jgi:hypothetical protein
MDVRLGDMVLVNCKFGIVPAILVEQSWDAAGEHLVFEFGGQHFGAIRSDIRPLHEFIANE